MSRLLLHLLLDITVGSAVSDIPYSSLRFSLRVCAFFLVAGVLFGFLTLVQVPFLHVVLRCSFLADEGLWSRVDGRGGIDLPGDGCLISHSIP